MGGDKQRRNLYLLFVNTDNQRNLSYESHGLVLFTHAWKNAHKHTTANTRADNSVVKTSHSLFGRQLSQWACACLAAFFFRNSFASEDVPFLWALPRRGRKAVIEKREVLVDSAVITLHCLRRIPPLFWICSRQQKTAAAASRRCEVGC